jgi:acyl carrier protein
MDELTKSLSRALVSRFGVKGEVDEDTPLFSGGLIDSLSVMDLVSFVEGEIGGTIHPADITLENFDSIGRIVRFVQKVSAAKGAGE